MEQALIISSVLLWVLVLFNLILTLALVRRQNSTTTQSAADQQGLAIGDEAPDFVAETLKGEQVTLANYLGKPVAFIFVGPDCSPCREVLPSIEAVRPIAERAGTQLVLVSDGTTDATRAMVEEFQIKSPVLIAPLPDNTFMKDYKMRGTPSYTLIDLQGQVQSTGRPHLTRNQEWKRVVDAWETSSSRSAIVAG